MRKLLIVFFISLFGIFQTFGQASRLYTEVQEAKSRNVNFKKISFFQAANADTAVLEVPLSVKTLHHRC